MRLLVAGIDSMAKRHPWLMGCVVLLLAGALFLPSLHHLADHHHDTTPDGDCQLCLLLNLNFLALPICFALDLARRVGALAPGHFCPDPASVLLRIPGARAPPLSR